MPGDAVEALAPEISFYEPDFFFSSYDGSDDFRVQHLRGAVDGHLHLLHQGRVRESPLRSLLAV